MVAQNCKLSTQLKQEDYYLFEASLSSIANFPASKGCIGLNKQTNKPK